MYKIAFLTDGHYPFQIDLNPAFNFLADFKPNRIIFGGDWLDLAYLSHWQELSPGKWENRRLGADYADVRKIIINVQRKIKPSRIDYMIGNHEDWIDQFLNKFPTLKADNRGENGVMDLVTGLRTKELNINVIPYNKVLTMGHLNFMHGMYINDAHAKKTITTYQKCMRYGHTHDHQVHSFISPLDSNSIKNAMSVGCLCNKNPDYNNGRPNRWQHGFYVAYIRDNGDFSDYFIPIIKGHFVFNDKLY